jgi:hypothetical protein
MAGVRATVGVAAVDSFNLSFNEIIGHVPGRQGRDDARPGTYEDRNGKILIVFSKNPQLVEIEARRNGRKTNRTGLTRTGMAMIGRDGAMRMVTCDRDPDGDKKWKVSNKTVTIGGNPHVVPNPPEAQAAEGEFDDDKVEE